MESKEITTAIQSLREKSLLFGGKGRIADILQALNDNKLTKEDVAKLIEEDAFTDFHPDHFEWSKDKKKLIISDEVLNRIKELEKKVDHILKNLL